jgi:phospholipid/cholesterol/gamma-HCH transport system substrate-binding protein
LNVLASSLRRLSEQTERDPSSLVLGNRSLSPGPGEKAKP